MQIGLPFREADTDMSFDAIKQPMVDWVYGKDYFDTSRTGSLTATIGVNF